MNIYELMLSSVTMALSQNMHIILNERPTVKTIPLTKKKLNKYTKMLRFMCAELSAKILLLRICSRERKWRISLGCEFHIID